MRATSGLSWLTAIGVTVIALASCNSGDRSKENALKEIKVQVAEIAEDLPVSYRHGYTFESISVSDTDKCVRYIYRIDTARVSYISFIAEKEKLKAQLRNSLLRTDEKLLQYTKNTAIAGYNFCYRYEFNDGNFLELSVDPRELVQVQ